MKLYRAVPLRESSEQAVETLEEGGFTTRRIPKNIPYLVDNVWEFLRPRGAPSRRHAAYASPTPELALQNASSAPGKTYEVCEVVLRPEAMLVVCSVSDERLHADVRQLPIELLAVLGEALSTGPVAQNLGLAPLFMPAVPAEDLRAFFGRHPNLAERCRMVSRFWNDACLLTLGDLGRAPGNAGDAEIFFDARRRYQLKRH